MCLVNIYGINSQALEAVKLLYKIEDQLTGNIKSILMYVLNASVHGRLLKEAQKILMMFRMINNRLKCGIHL